MNRALSRIVPSLALVLAASLASGCGGASRAAPASNVGTTAGAASTSGASASAEPSKVPLHHQKGENIFKGAKLYVDHDHQVKRLANALRKTDPAKAAALDKIADQPAVEWLGEWNANIEWTGKAKTKKMNDEGALAVYLVYNIPNRDCGQYSKGGVTGPAAYKDWISKLAKGIGGGRAAVILEPDALGQLKQCLSPADQQARLDMLKYAVHVLEANGNTAVYLDAGNPHWVLAKEMAERLKSAGIDEADGFALNVSNYMTTEDNIKYGKEISALVGGKHFVIDTSRNGNGPTPDFDWCNPHGRALGHKPTADTGDPLVDAFLWIKRPGESDGECKGGPKAGQFWLDMALELSNNAKF